MSYELRKAIERCRRMYDPDGTIKTVADVAESTLPPAPEDYVIIGRRPDGHVFLFDYMGTKLMCKGTAEERAQAHSADYPSNTYTVVKLPAIRINPTGPSLLEALRGSLGERHE